MFYLHCFLCSIGTMLFDGGALPHTLISVGVPFFAQHHFQLVLMRRVDSALEKRLINALRGIPVLVRLVSLL